MRWRLQRKSFHHLARHSGLRAPSRTPAGSAIRAFPYARSSTSGAARPPLTGRTSLTSGVTAENWRLAPMITLRNRSVFRNVSRASNRTKAKRRDLIRISHLIPWGSHENSLHRHDKARPAGHSFQTSWQVFDQKENAGVASLEQENRLVLQPLTSQFIRSLRGSLKGEPYARKESPAGRSQSVAQATLLRNLRRRRP